MRKKTSKLLRKYAKEAHIPIKDLKRGWNRIPRNQRGLEAQRMRDYIA